MKKVFIIFSIFLVVGLNIEVFTQENERKKPELKDFGSSLNRSPEENSAPPKVKKTESPADDDIIRIDTNLVVADFLVLDKKGNAVYGLKKEDFVVTEDKQPQEIQTFTLGDDAKIPRSIVLIIDYSGSQLPYIERSVEAAKLLVDKLRPNDLMAIVTDDVELIAQFTNDKNILKEKLDSLKVNALEKKKLGKSQQFSSLYAVLNEMFDEEDVRPIILFQTDGDQFNSLKGGYVDIVGPPLNLNTLIKIPNFSFNDLLAAIEKDRATIYTIVPGFKLLGLTPAEKSKKMREEVEMRRKLFEENPNLRPNPITVRSQISPPQIEELKKSFAKRVELINKYFPNGPPDVQEVMAGMSKYSGGWIDFLEKPEQAEEIYNRILSEINTRYLIGYYPTNEAKDGKRRIVKIEVKNHPEYTVWGRKTYIAPLQN